MSEGEWERKGREGRGGEGRGGEGRGGEGRGGEGRGGEGEVKGDEYTHLFLDFDLANGLSI